MAHSDFCPTNTSAIPGQWRFARATDKELQDSYDSWEAEYENACCEDYENRCGDILLQIEKEQDSRELWNHDDPRVRESVGNYR